MSYTDVWNALADPFEDVAADSPIELANYPEGAGDFDWEVFRSRILFRYRQDEQVPTERLFSIRAEGPEPYIRRKRVNRFRWLWSDRRGNPDRHQTPAQSGRLRLMKSRKVQL